VQNGLTLEASVSYGAAPYTFLWNTGEITQNINPTNWGNVYFVVANDVNNCIDTSNYLIALGVETIQISNKRLISILDLIGRETTLSNKPLIYIYDDGTVEKRITIE
jgi:hypothetical protein